MGQTNRPASNRGASLPTRLGLALLLIAFGSLAATKPISAQDVDTLNAETGRPALLFTAMPNVEVNGRLVQLAGLTQATVIVKMPDGSITRIPNRDVRQVIDNDGGFVYTPKTQSLEQFLITTLQSFPLIENYGVVINDASLNQAIAMAIDGEPGATGGTAFESGAIPTVPLPIYQSEKPWETVQLLNPPKIRRRPVVSTPPPLPPPVVEAAESKGGIPDWGKYAIAATGIAAIFVLFKR